MKNEILDENFYIKKEINSKDDIKKALREMGILTFYEHKDGYIIIEKGDAIRLRLEYKNNRVSITPKFPQIGNSIQWVASGILLAIFVFVIAVPFPFQWVLAIIGGQLLSYLFYQPKIKALKAKLEQVLV